MSLCFLFQAHAQFEFMQYENASYNLKRSNTSNNSLNINHVKSYTLKKLCGKDYIKSFEYLYNSSVRLTDLIAFKKNGKKKYSYSYRYKNDTLITNYTVLNCHSDTSNWMSYQYDNKNRLTLREYKFSFFMIPDRKWKYQYNKQDKLSAYSLLDKKGNDSYRYEYDFYDNGSRKETRYYNSKNLLKYRWTFECDPKGAVENNKVKQGNYCTKKELHSDGSFMEVFEFTNEKGKHTKTVCYYDADSNMTKDEIYNKKGKLNYKWEYVHDKKGNTTEILYYKPSGLKKNFTYTYNEKNLCVKMDSYKKGKLKTSYTYDYNYSNQ